MAIPCTPIFLLSQTLGDVMQIRDWTLCGLPSDQFFIENAIIVKNTGRYPLMIDPQGKVATTSRTQYTPSISALATHTNWIFQFIWLPVMFNVLPSGHRSSIKAIYNP